MSKTTLVFPDALDVPPAYVGERVDYTLAQSYPDYSRSQFSRWLQDGHIRVNNQLCKPKYKLQSKDVICFNLDDALTETVVSLLPEAIALELVYEDDALLIINKPAGLVVHPGAGNPCHTLVNALLHYHPALSSLPRAGIIHRLDKDTTGLLIVAKNLPAYTHLTRQMQAREIKRSYCALVHGHVIAGGTLSTGYGRHPRDRLKMTVMGQGRSATTHYAVKQHYLDYPHFTLLEVNLLTGRTHQIRVHMAHLKHPIVGDSLYGGRTRFPPKAPESFKIQLQGFQRQALHAINLSLQHPLTKAPLAVHAPLPHDFEQLLESLSCLKPT
ncbi:MAG: 23S rRNA pseudouridine(1911/1915/1917) synthase RluD [Legionella sp.]|nr:23S rRNA pseudouridine(1911/1915/1917) synthase RluD [Legionella sp.]